MMSSKLEHELQDHSIHFERIALTKSQIQDFELEHLKNPDSKVLEKLKKAGGKLIGGYYTFGEYDVIIIIEAPDDETLMSLMLKVGSAGNVRTNSKSIYS
jgi:GYD domain